MNTLESWNSRIHFWKAEFWKLNFKFFVFVFFLIGKESKPNPIISLINSMILQQLRGGVLLSQFVSFHFVPKSLGWLAVAKLEYKGRKCNSETYQAQHSDSEVRIS